MESVGVAAEAGPGYLAGILEHQPADARIFIKSLCSFLPGNLGTFLARFR